MRRVIFLSLLLAASLCHGQPRGSGGGSGALISTGQIQIPCNANQVLKRGASLWACGNAQSQTEVSFTAADTTPEVSASNQFYRCDDTTVYTDFVDSDGDHSDFSENFSFVFNAASTCGIDCSAGNVACNGGASWAASIGDSALCTFSVTNDSWSCILSEPDAVSAMTNESSTIVAPGTATIDWVRMSGDATASAWGSDGSVMNLDIDNNQEADCTFSKANGVVTLDCKNTNATFQPGQTNGDIKFNDSTGAECLELDPDTGALTQGTNCATLAFDKAATFGTTLGVTGVATFISDANAAGELTGSVRFSSTTVATKTLSSTDCLGGLHMNGDADALDITLCDGQAGGGQLVCFEDRAGGIITVDVNDASEVITLADGTALTAGNAIDLASGIGNGFCIFSDSATAWHVLPGAVGTISDGGAD